MDDAYCGGGDTGEGLTNTAIPIQASALKNIAAAIFMGDPRYIYGLSYEVGTCTAEGVSLLYFHQINFPLVDIN
jgi:acetylxylan esterase